MDVVIGCAVHHMLSTLSLEDVCCWVPHSARGTTRLRQIGVRPTTDRIPPQLMDVAVDPPVEYVLSTLSIEHNACRVTRGTGSPTILGWICMLPAMDVPEYLMNVFVVAAIHDALGTLSVKHVCGGA